jgi:hypothetical protein
LYIRELKERVDSTIDTLAVRNRIDSEPIKLIITDASLSAYCLQIITWWQEGIASGEWVNAPLYDGEKLNTALESQTALTGRQKQSVLAALQKQISRQVIDVNQSVFSATLAQLPTASIVRWFLPVKVIIGAAIAALILLLIIALIRRIALLTWYTGLLFFFGGCYLAVAGRILVSLDIPQKLAEFSPSLGNNITMLLNNLFHSLCRYSIFSLLIGVFLTVIYACLFMQKQRKRA